MSVSLMQGDAIAANGTRDGHRARPINRWLIAGVAIVALAGLAWGLLWLWDGPPRNSDAPAAWDIPAAFDEERVFGYLTRIVAFGPRPSGTEAMRRQQEYLTAHFTEAGAEVERQEFETRHPETGEAVVMTNLIARFRPDAPKRYLLCAHYDTRPFPDRDPTNPRGVFVGANDGGSGTAALMEFAHHVPRLPPEIGVDLILFDGEEFVFDSQRDPYFLGSTYFARSYAARTTNAAGTERADYTAGILLDMIGDQELQLYYERNSWNYARDVTVGIWNTARRLKIDAFQPRIRHLVRDDHIPLNEIAKIPTTNLIDFDYPRPGFRHQSYWHTEEDTLDKCSGRSMTAVIYVVHTWLASQAH